jgi:3',5'-cyclic AMP phosphodiesterase CpdA
VLDTTRPGAADGALDRARLDWLDAELAAAPDVLTVIAMHHPPFSSGVPAWDDVGIPGGDRRSLGDVLARHPQVRRIVAGHVHHATTGEVAGRPVLTVPSTYVQLRLDFGADAFEVTAEPAGFAVHAVRDGELTSHIRRVG